MLWAQSTDVPRAKVSLAMTLAGLFPPAGTAMEWSRELNWQAIAIEVEPLAEDSVSGHHLKVSITSQSD